MKNLFVLCSLVTLMACARPTSGPDKTAGGAVLGSAWGAGAGAVVGNQLGHIGPGAAIGAGFGLVNGALAGYAYDSLEPSLIEQKARLASMQVQNDATAEQLVMLQAKLDRAVNEGAALGVYQVFFDHDATNMRSGATANLEVIADSLRTSPSAYRINVIGHSDDGGTPDYNEKLAEARARSVASYLAARGISSDQIVLKSFGSSRPIASNSTETGRQLNRRVDVYIGR